MRKEKAEKPLPVKKKPNIFLRGVAFVVMTALVLGAIYLVVNRDKLNFDALKRWFTYRTLAQSDTGGGQPFPYESGGSLSLVACGGDLLAVSENGVRLYSPGGTAYIEDTVTLEHPTCQVSGRSAVVYDAGGTFLRVYRDRKQAFELTGNSSTLLSARMGTGGFLSVITRSSGHKGMVTVYDNDFRVRLELKLSSAYILDAVVSPDNKWVLAVTAAQENQLFDCKLAKYSLTDLEPDNPTPEATLSLGSHLPLDLVWDGGGIRVLSEYAAISADNSLSETGRAEWSDRYLKRFSLLGDNFFTVLTGKYHAGSQTDLALFDSGGETLASLEENRSVLSLSAAGRYVAVLTSEKLSIYTADLKLYAETEDIGGASRVVVLPDGSAYLATRNKAWLYLPQ